MILKIAVNFQSVLYLRVNNNYDIINNNLIIQIVLKTLITLHEIL